MELNCIIITNATVFWGRSYTQIHSAAVEKRNFINLNKVMSAYARHMVVLQISPGFGKVEIELISTSNSVVKYTHRQSTIKQYN